MAQGNMDFSWREAVTTRCSGNWKIFEPLETVSYIYGSFNESLSSEPFDD